MLPNALKDAKFYPVVMLTADALKHLAPQAGQAATNMARSAKTAGEDLAGIPREPTNSLTSSVDGALQKDDESAKTPLSDKNVATWGLPRSQEKPRDPEQPK
jgi:membrane protein required for colicin V production